MLLCRSLSSEHEFHSVCSPKFRREGDQSLSYLVVLCVAVYRHGKLHTVWLSYRSFVSLWPAKKLEQLAVVLAAYARWQGTAGHGSARSDRQFPTTIAVQVTRQKDKQTADIRRPSLTLLSCAAHTNCCCYTLWPTTAIITRPSLIHATWFTKRRGISVEAFPLMSFSFSGSSPNSNIDKCAAHTNSCTCFKL